MPIRLFDGARRRSAFLRAGRPDGTIDGDGHVSEVTDIEALHSVGPLDIEADLPRAIGEALDLAPVDDRDTAAGFGEEIGGAARVFEADLGADQKDEARLLIAGRDDLRIGAGAARCTASARRGEIRKVSRRGNASPSMNW